MKKRKIYYDVSKPGYWWDNKMKVWTKDISQGHGYSSHRVFKTATKAFNHSRHFQCPIVVRRIRDNYGWLMQEFNLRENE